jgi:Putative transposase
VALPELVSPPREYRQHRPEETLHYRIVADHLETFLGHAREHHDHGLPAYVENELRSYLKCGIHAHGFLRARCKACGKG